MTRFLSAFHVTVSRPFHPLQSVDYYGHGSDVLTTR
jgi:hypothetical protein